MPDDADPGPDPTPDDAELIAYLDGELDPAAARRLEDRMAADPALRRRAVALKQTYALLDYLPKPDPSATFATRTLDRIPAVKPSASTSSPAVNAPPAPGSPSSSVPMILPTGPMAVPMMAAPPRRGLAWVAGVLLAALAAGAAGYALTGVFRPPPAPIDTGSNTLAFTDRRVIEHLPLYAAADDYEFVVKLSDPELFGDDPAVTFDGPPAPPGADTTDKPTGPQLDALVKAFQALPPDRQAAIRKLDQRLNDQPPATRDRLFRVLEAYVVWLNGLPEAERRGVLAAATPDLRLGVVHDLRERQWLESLPAAIRKNADPTQRAELVKRWKEEEAERRRTWAFTRTQWDAINKGDRTPWPFADEAMRKEVVEFARTAYRPDNTKYDDRPRCRLTVANGGELERYREALDRAEKQNEWAWYGKTVYDLSRKYETLPEPASGKPVVDVSDLGPLADRFSVKGKGKQAVQPTLGKWPEFALEVHRFMTDTKGGVIPANVVLGPSKPAEFKPEVREFLPALEKKAKPAEWTTLRQLEGKWPEYPRELIRLAKQYDLSVPGAMPPGKPSLWEKTYNPPRGGPKPGG